MKSINFPLINVLVSLFTFLFVFFTPLDYSLNKYGGTYVYTPDTGTYFPLYWDPWKSTRTPGYPLFLYPFLEPHRKELAAAFKMAHKKLAPEDFSTGFHECLNEAGLQGVFDNIVLCQRLLLSIGAAFLVYTCALFINPLVVGGCFFLCVKMLPLVNPTWLITECVAQPLSFFTIGLLLLFFRKRNFLFLFLAALCASFLYLVRPAGVYMLALGGICWLYFFWKDRFHHVFKFLFSATGFLPAVAYIGYLSITSGYLLFGTHPESSDLQFSCYFLQKEDIENMPTLRAREYARIQLDKVEFWKKEISKLYWPDFEEWPRTKSFGFLYNYSAWPITYMPENEVLRELSKNPQIGPLNLKQRVMMGRELKKGMLKRHSWDRIKTVGCNILAGLGYYSDFPSSTLKRKYGFPLMVCGWGVWCIALLLCQEVRFCLLLPGAAHLLHVFAISYGNSIGYRYVDLTEPLFAFAVFLSLWALACRLWQFYRKTSGARGRETMEAAG
ncbi:MULTISPECIES: hypothetical protein [unclassified Desulfovibrio]|uniref:hypothetical protein n=1 Tax=unclassified Desulfovibrio TaxID=2593640 RepID=UPI0013ECF377|nr:MULTISPECIES: hypothetical protein [unclassified Desulfovibrio]